MKTSSVYSVPKEMRPVYDQITRLTDAFSATHLNDEFDKGLIPYIPALKNQHDDSGGLDI